LVAARDALLSAGERGRAAECESMLTWLAWYAGNHADAFAHAERARELAVGLPIGRSRAEVVTSAARFLVVADQPEQAIGLAHEALALSEQAGADDLRLIGLTYLGTARVSLGDLEGIRDLEQAIELGRELRSPELVRSLVNLAAIHVGLGDLTRAFELHGEARLAATRLGHARGARWLRGELVGECYWTGRWDEAVRLADEFLAEGEHYLASFCLTARGKVFLGRGDTARAAADAEQAVRLARDANDAQVLYPAVAFAAEVEAACANRDAANALVDELLASYSGAELVTAGPAWASLSRAAAALGRGGEIGSVVERARLSTRWLDAAQLVASGRWGEAADVYEKLGSRADAEAARAASVAV
jgi:tetratricopeptide (TPR) repeat protein